MNLGCDQNAALVSHNIFSSYFEGGTFTDWNGEVNIIWHHDYLLDNYGRTGYTNNGHYLPRYNDIDGSRNDAGTRGGPQTINNHFGLNNTGQTGKARVHYLSIPDFLATPDTIQMKGGAHTVR